MPTLLGEVTILLVEDSKVDAELIAEALKDSQLPHRLDLARDGQEALDLLQGQEERPHLVLLDLNLPKVSGLEVLKAMRRDPKLRIVPVIVLTNSHYQEDVARCYANYCNAYIRKPLGYDGLATTIQQTSDFWFKTATLPGAYVTAPPNSLAPSKKK